MLKSAAQQSLGTIDALLSRIETKKQAKAESDPGGMEGGSSHPTADTENGTVEPSEGAHATEMAADIKHDVPAGVGEAAEGMPGGQEAVQNSIGTQQSSPGEDPANETPMVADKLPDPGSIGGDTSHPADLDSIGEKYGMARRVLAKMAAVQDAGHALLGKIVVANTPVTGKKAGDEVLPPETVTGADDAKPSGASPTGGSVSDTSEKKTDDVEKAGKAGEKMAEVAMLAQQQRDEFIVNTIADTIKEAHQLAEITADFLNGQKRAGDDEGGEEKKEESGKSEGGGDSGPPSGGDSGGGPPSAGPAGGGAPPMGGGGGGGEPDLLSLLAGGENMGAGDAMAGMGGGADVGGGGGGMPPGAGGGDPMMGGAPGGAPPMGGAGGGSDPEAIAMLMEALTRLGIPVGQAQAKVASLLETPPANAAGNRWVPRNQKEAEHLNQVMQMLNEIAGKR